MAATGRAADMTTYETLLTEWVQPALLRVTLNRPRVANALNTQMGRELLALWSGLAADPGAVRCVVLTGAGDRVFCAGADLKERHGMSDADWQAQHVIFERQYGALLDVARAGDRRGQRPRLCRRPRDGARLRFRLCGADARASR